MSELTFSIGEVAAMLGISPHTIRAWERRHLVLRPTRTPSGQRRYAAEDVELLRQIKHERRVHGFSMRVATMTAHGLIVPEAREPSAAPTTPVTAEAGPDLLRLVPDLMSDVVVVLDARGRIVHANTAFVRVTGMLLGQMRGLAFADLADPFDRAKAVQAYQAPLRQRRGWELNLRAQRRRAFFSFDCWPVEGDDGSVLVLVGRDLEATWRDAGDAGRPAADAGDAEDRLRPAGGEVPPELRALLQGVADPMRTLQLLRPWLDAIPAGVVLARADAQLTVLFANRALGRRLPPEPASLEGQPWRRLAPEHDAGRVVAAAAEAVGSGQIRHVPGTRPAAGGAPDRSVEEVWDVALCPVTGGAGEVTHLLISIHDVTAEVAALDRLRVLGACGDSLWQARDARQLLAAAARHARALLPNTGTLVAAADGGLVGVVDATGVWSPAAESSEHEVRMALVRDAVETRASIEVERARGEEAVETLRVVPLPPGPASTGAPPVAGALAFSRPGPGSFSADDRLLIDEFAGRVGMALGRVHLLGAARDRAGDVAV